MWQPDKRTFFILFLGIMAVGANAQYVESPENKPEIKQISVTNRTTEPFSYAVTTLTPEDLKWSIHYSGSYGNGVEGPFGYDGVSQQVAVKGYLGKQFTLYANAAVGFPRGGNSNVASAQQAEIIRDFYGGKKNMGFRLGAGLGVSNDFSNAKSLLSRITASYDTPFLKASANLLLEHTFLGGRDPIDVITNIGFQYRLINNLYGGLEFVGQDLEGLWDQEEAEGGAKMLIGPSLNLAPKKSKFSFSLCCGPEFAASHSTLTNPDAIRQLLNQPGFTVMARVIYNLYGI